jgi:hypothetical protein
MNKTLITDIIATIFLDLLLNGSRISIILLIGTLLIEEVNLAIE